MLAPVLTYLVNNIYTSITHSAKEAIPTLKPNKQFSKNATKYYTGHAPAKFPILGFDVRL
jgi:hypothetical protein